MMTPCRLSAQRIVTWGLLTAFFWPQHGIAQIQTPPVPPTPPTIAVPTKPLVTPPTPATGLNTKIYEKENGDRSFTAKVKIVREVQGQWEVFFDARPGAYLITEEQQASFVKYQEDKTPVNIQFDPETNQVLSASPGAAPKVKGDKTGVLGL